MNSWNSVVSGPTGEEWGEFRKPGEPGESEDLEEQGVRGEDWEEAELKVRSLIAELQEPVTSSVFSWSGDKCPGIRWPSSASCSASLIMEWICTKVFAKVFPGFFENCGSISSSSTNIGEPARSSMVVSTGGAKRIRDWGAKAEDWGELSQDEAIGDEVTSESWPTPRKMFLWKIEKKNTKY